MATLTAAITEYFEREAAANKMPAGADHSLIMREVAEKFGLVEEELAVAVIDETVKGFAK